MLSSVSPSYIIAVSLAGPLITVLSLTGGFFANIAELPVFVSWIQYLSWFRFVFLFIIFFNCFLKQMTIFINRKLIFIKKNNCVY